MQLHLINEKIKEEFKKDSLIHKLSFPELMKKYSISRWACWYWRKRLNLPKRVKGIDYYRPTKFPNEHLPPNLLSIIYGCLMGDGYIIPPLKNSYLVIGHSAKQLDYLKWKHTLFGKWAHRIRPINHPDGLQYRFQTPAHSDFTNLRKLLYPNPVGKRSELAKIVEPIIPLLTLQSIAIWYGDDGCLGFTKDSPRVWFSTDGFNSTDLSLVIKLFQEKFGISPHLLKRGKGYKIYFLVEDSRKFIRIIKPYLPKCMHYKVRFSKNE